MNCQAKTAIASKAAASARQGGKRGCHANHASGSADAAASLGGNAGGVRFAFASFALLAIFISASYAAACIQVWDGTYCASDSECCSGYCATGHCSCAPQGNSCSDSSQCCGGLACLNAMCSSQPYTCSLGAGSSCTSNGTSPGCCASGLACALLGPDGSCCIPTDSPRYSCTSGADCCSGKCEPGSGSFSRCVSAWSCAHSCSADYDCSALCQHCAQPSGGGAAACSSCIESNSPTSCLANSDCCGGICDPSSSKCVSCISTGAVCTFNAQCCTGRCESGVCAAAISACSPRLGECSAGRGCCSGGSLFCDYNNTDISRPKNQTYPVGVCRDCIPGGFSCDGSQPCCDAAYSCRNTSITNGARYCLADPDGPSKQLFSRWAKDGSGVLVPAESQGISGSAAAQLSGGSSSFLYDSSTILNNDTAYSLEFWAKTDGMPGTGPVQYAIYDAYNDAYLAANGSWSYSSPVLLSSNATTSSYSKVTKIFRTLSGNVSMVQIRLAAPENGTAYADDLALTRLPDFTIMAWVYPASNANYATLFKQLSSENGLPQGIYWYFNSTGMLYMGSYSSYGVGGNSVVPEVEIPSNGWHHVALSVRRFSDYHAYLDGVQFASGNFTIGRLNGSEEFDIGAASSPSYNGSLDELRIYGTALSGVDIFNHVNGKYQATCQFQMKSYYPHSGATPSSGAAYNAYLRVRSLPPEVVLSLPMDTQAPNDRVATVTDYSSSLVAGTDFGPVWTPNGKVGGAYTFNSSGEKITFPVPFVEGPQDFTFSAWVYPYTSPGKHFIMGNYGHGNPDGVQLYLENGVPKLSLQGNIVQGNQSVPAGAWAHLAAIRSNGTAAIYVNAQLAGSGSLPGNISGNAAWTNSSLPASRQFRDDFNQSELLKEWQFYGSPGEGFNYTDDHLRIWIKYRVGGDCWDYYYGNQCARLMRKDTNVPNMTYEVKIDGVPFIGQNRQMYGIILWQDDFNFIRFEYRYQSSTMIEMFNIVNGTGYYDWSTTYGNPGNHYPIGGQPEDSLMDVANNSLRVVRNGSNFGVYFMTPKTSGWVNAFNFTRNDFNVSYSGMHVIYAGYLPATTGNFDYFIGGPPVQPKTLYPQYFSLGGGIDYTDDDYKGVMDEVRVYSKALSGSEVSGLYHDSGLLTSGPVESYYK